jgi:hypothetical protein
VLLQRLTRVIADALQTPDGAALQSLGDDVAADAALVRAYEEQMRRDLQRRQGGSEH